MNTATAQAFTVADVQAFADLIRPALNQVSGLSAAESIEAAALITRREEDAKLARLLTQTHTIAQMLSGTYEEFRVEVAEREQAIARPDFCCPKTGPEAGEQR